MDLRPLSPALACVAFVLVVMTAFSGCSYTPALAQTAPSVWLVPSPCDDIAAERSPGDCFA